MADYGSVPTSDLDAVRLEPDQSYAEQGQKNVERRKQKLLTMFGGILVLAAVLGLSFSGATTVATKKSNLESIEDLEGTKDLEDSGENATSYSVVSNMVYSPHAPAFFEPPRVSSKTDELNVHLYFDVSRVQIDNVSLNMRLFNGALPAPTMVVRRGQRLRIQLWNHLSSDLKGGHAMNAFRRPNTTVLHTHGLHVSPADADNIYRAIEPQMHAQFLYPIPKNHPVGTFWLHPHFHGSTTLQSAYGAFAAIIIEEEAGSETTPATLPVPLDTNHQDEKQKDDDKEKDKKRKKRKSNKKDDDKSVDKGDDDSNSSSKSVGPVHKIEGDHIMLVGWVDIGSGKRTDILEDERLSKSQMNVDLRPRGYSTNGGFLTVNGRPNSTLAMKAGELQRWRVINGVVDGSLRILFNESACSVAAIAADGVSYPAPRQVSPEQGVLIVPGSRRDLLVRCISDSKIWSELDPTRGEEDEKIYKYLGKKSKIASGLMLHVHAKDQRSDLKLESAHSGVQVPSETGYTAEPLKDLRGANVDVKTLVEYTQGGPNTAKARREGNNYTYYGINGQAYDPEVIGFTVKLDQVVEWTVRNEYCMDGTPALESHPFHLHTNHYQIVNVSSPETGNYSPDFEIGDWRDTVAVPAPGNVTIRWVARDFTGRSLLHCHTIAHHDTGMAARVDITH
mmetsp:Transcript_483/g.1176  ORF Transcript_483/g.1176 Transcript_483/m.1176 type:complete len:675 (-) Transcript_483:34-2058(-)|eukprot:CAMPEP_0171495732 /NCGR_PEP_ID=MMETSP0958-20121227/6301_1 /TAXON_ID=87120 /ORGANISM="Aurantiochytrium limacinum, Strain ATCCMYA-1381" /LENGTH=674 /DNA_ID=CAMNT_0012029739 /DNA_START=171 /DNA_END=2195 /DNA_ORIENTATION=-